MSVRFTIFFFIVLIQCYSQAYLWHSKNQWNQEWEDRYSNWISTVVDENYFVNNPLETDCADAVIALRIIFSRENSLPFQFTTGKGDKVSNLSFANQVNLEKPWSQDENFKKALNQILDLTSSATLSEDAFPVALRVGSLVSGAFFIQQHQGIGHVDLIHKVVLNRQVLPLRMLSSTAGRKVRQLSEYPFFYILSPQNIHAGFFKFKWVKEVQGHVMYDNSLRSEYSLEQYNLKLQNQKFSDYVTYKMLNYSISDEAKLYDYLNLFKLKIKERIDIVKQGYELCSRQPCQANSDEFYNYSTPSRDGNISYIKMLADDLILHSRESNFTSFQNLSELFENLMSEEVFLATNFKIRFSDIFRLWNLNKLSSDPNDSIAKRWNLEELKGNLQEN